MMQPAGYLAFSLHGENRSHHTVANRGNYLRRPRPLLPPSCGRGVGSPKADHRRLGLPLGLRPPPLLPSQGLYSLAVFFLPPSTSPLSKIMAVVTETTPLASHLPSSIALLFFFLVPPHNPTSWKVSTPAVFTSLPVVRSAAHSNLASIPPTQLKWLPSTH